MSFWELKNLWLAIVKTISLMKIFNTVHFKSLAAVAVAVHYSSTAVHGQAGKKKYSGIYPHLAFYNNESECGTGAVVPWANRLWIVTYGPHLPSAQATSCTRSRRSWNPLRDRRALEAHLPGG